MSLKGNKIHFTSLGCARNLVDSEVMLGLLLRRGYEIVPEAEKADYLVVNTCGFLSASRRESCEVIAELSEAKKEGAKLIVTGCMVQKHREELSRLFPAIHYFLGSGDVEKILDAVESKEQGEQITSARSYLEWGEVPRQLSTPSHFAYLKIAEGCAKRCSFCIIPLIKGPLKSKSLERIVQEFRSLLAQGVKEIILIAQDLGDWGKETKEKQNLTFLLRTLLEEKGDFWIRLLYLYPDEITDELISVIKSDPRICPYLDSPMQHISDPILRAMRRKTSASQIKETISKLRHEIPQIVIRTSLMVGFPGEDDSHFADLISFVEEYQLDNIGIFTYSKEDESHSAKLAGHIPEEIKKERFDRLVAAQQKVAFAKNRSYIGKKIPVVVEGYHPESEFLLRGRFYGQCPEIDGQVILNDFRKVKAFGERYEVKITDAAGYDLIGNVVKADPWREPRKTSSLTLVTS